MRILVFQHIAVEHPGIFRDFLAADGVAWDAVELDTGAAIPDLGRYDALWVMGGPMDVWQEAEHPWLVPEKRAIREAVVERGMPYLGVCLGHQLLAAALGGTVGPMQAPEVGLLEVELTDAGARDPLLAGFPRRIRCLQWHGAEVSTPPAGAVVLARSGVSPVQGFRVGRAAYGLQYHVELTGQTVPEWSCVPEYEASLECTLGAAALPAFKAEAERLIPAFNRDARRLYDNFMRLAVRQAA